MASENIGDLLTIGAFAERAGVSAERLRIWERRYGFPEPRRLASGHRRYDLRDVEVISQALADHEAGLELAVAIERARAAASGPRSVYADVRRAAPHLQPVALSKRMLVQVSRALEDEIALRGDGGVLVGSFQRMRFYDAERARWRDLARVADVSAVFADFPRYRPGSPAQVPAGASGPLAREWAVAYLSRAFAVVLAARELPRTRRGRRFEAVWTTEARIVDDALRSAAAAARDAGAATADEIANELASIPAPPPDVGAAVAVANRMLGRLDTTPG